MYKTMRNMGIKSMPQRGSFYKPVQKTSVERRLVLRRLLYGSANRKKMTTRRHGRTLGWSTQQFGEEIKKMKNRRNKFIIEELGWTDFSKLLDSSTLRGIDITPGVIEPIYHILGIQFL